jgi:hypothetical protein
MTPADLNPPRKVDGWFVTAVVVYFANLLGWAAYFTYKIWSTTP